MNQEKCTTEVFYGKFVSEVILAITIIETTVQVIWESKLDDVGYMGLGIKNESEHYL